MSGVRLAPGEAGRWHTLAQAWPVWLMVLAVAYRALPYVLDAEGYFDSDQATVGLMGWRLTHGKGIPWLTYGARYMMVPTAFLAAPLFLWVGPSVMVLKLVELAFNMGGAALLYFLLRREVTLSRAGAALACTWLWIPGCATSNFLLQSSGGNAQVFVWIPLIWLTRRRPWVWGVCVALGTLNRAFVLYGVVALCAVELLWEHERWKAWLKERLLGALVFTVVNTGWIEAARLSEDYRGTYGAAAFQAWERMALNAHYLLTVLLPHLVVGGQDQLWISAQDLVGPHAPWAVLLLALLLGGGFLLLRLRLKRLAQGQAPQPAMFTSYLMAVSLLSLVGTVAFTPWMLDPGMVRYLQLALLGLVGITAQFLTTPSRTMLQRAWVGALVLCCGYNMVQNSAPWRQLGRVAGPTPHQALAQELQARHIEYAFADYWVAGQVSFLSGERTRVASNNPARLQEYQRAYRDHLKDAVDIQDAPCAPNLLIFVQPPWFICRAVECQAQVAE